MKSGLEGRNNIVISLHLNTRNSSLNEVRPRRPEQSTLNEKLLKELIVSMKSGLEGRNNLILLMSTSVSG